MSSRAVRTEIGDVPDVPPVQRRRRQVDRSAETRERVIAAALELLHRQGYQGASTIAIARHARLSQGALQHQFPTKAALMNAVLRRSVALRYQTYRRALAGVPRGLPRFRALSEASWSLIGSDEISASLEIELAMRNDPELAAAVAPTFRRHSAFVQRLIGRMLDDAFPGVANKAGIIRLLNNAVMIGLSVETARGTDPDAIAAAVAGWREILFGNLLPAIESR